jgi:hypothetical protein
MKVDVLERVSQYTVKDWQTYSQKEVSIGKLLIESFALGNHFIFLVIRNRIDNGQMCLGHQYVTTANLKRLTPMD